MKKGVCISTVILLVLGMASLSCKMVERGIKIEAKKEKAAKEEIINNKICPVCGGKIIEEMKVPCKHKDTICYVCSLDCAQEFRKEPEKYLERLEEMSEKMSEIKSKQSQERLDRSQSSR